MRAIAHTIEALALPTNEEERKKERGAKSEFAQLPFPSFRMILDSRKVQLVIKTLDNEG